ncbi:hypothetical protein QQ045_026069 [Rhodiola kirilowii]
MMMSSSSSSSSAVIRVDKATSELLIGPDWTMNMEICDSINSNHWQAKDVVKALKKRLQHKSSTVQLLALTLLETMVKNCGDYVHFQIVDRNLLQEMVKIVRKKADTNVRNKILVLLDSWQEAFGGPGGKYPQYYWTYEELRRSGVQFPERSQDAAPIFTPPVTHPPVRQAQSSYGMPSNASARLDEAMASETESLSLFGLDAIRRVTELLTDMLRAVNPSDREAVKDELIVDLVDQCHSNQKRLMQMLTSTGDEELLARGLELNDNLQSVLAKHDAIASGLPPPMDNQVQVADNSSQSTVAGASSSSSVRDHEKEPEPVPNSNSIVPVGPDASSQVEDEEEDDFALLARRHSKHPNSQTGNTENLLSSASTTAHGSPSAETSLSSSPGNALVLADPLPPVRTSKDQDMIDLLSLALTTTSPHSPAPPSPITHEKPVSPTMQVHPNGFSTYPSQDTYNNYVAPWSHAQPQPQPLPLPLPRAHSQQFHAHNNFQQQQQHGLSSSTEQHPFQPAQSNHLQQQHSQYPQNSPGYIPPPWAATPGYHSNQRPMFSNNTPQNYGTSSYTPTQPNRPQQYNSRSNVLVGPHVSSSPETAAPVAGRKPFIPSYRLFEDLDVFGNTDGRVKASSSGGSPSLSGGSGQGMVGGNK